MFRLDAALVLEDGRLFRGRGIGAAVDACGEVVFNTSMTGYQEIATDPSYSGQIVTFTAPQIGNYGVCRSDGETVGEDRARLSGIVVRDLSRITSNWRAEQDLGGWLADQGVAGISEVDTRALTRHLRDRGAMRGGIFRVDQHFDRDELVARVRSSPEMEGLDLASQAATAEPYTVSPASTDHRVVLLDFGVKQSIIDCLTARSIAVDVVPGTTSADEILGRAPHGVVLSNGPGDPAAVGYGVETAKQLVGRLPVLGICLGHQLLGIALGARRFKMTFGHHGGNHPVADKTTGEVWITAQNHGFAIDGDSLPERARITHVSLYDGTLEGFELPDDRCLAIQFHPEGGPGPSDAEAAFDRFAALLRGERRMGEAAVAAT